MGDTPDRIDPSGIPTFTGKLPELEKHIAGLRGDASKVRKTGADTHTEFQKLSSFYKAPEADQLFATTQPVRDTADRFADDLTTVASALEGYATEVRPIVAKLKRLRAEAVAFVEDIEDDDDWQYDGDKVDKNNDLVKDVSATVAQFWAAERAAANKITSLVNGGTVWREDDGSGGKNMYGYSVEDMKKAGETPWGKAVEEKHHAWEIGHWAKSFVWDGFIVEGVWGTLKGLGGLVGLQGWETFKQSWKGLGQLATGLAILTVPGGLIAYDLLPEGGVKNWARDSLKTTKEVGKSMVAWDEWRKNPGKAAGLVGFNVVTTVATGGAGAATKTGTAGKIAATAGKVGRAVDPMTYIVKAGAAGLGKMPRIGDVTASLTGLTTVKGVELPDGSIRLPDGQVFDPVSPNPPELPPGKSGVELPNGVPRLDVPEGAVLMPNGQFLCPDGTYLKADGSLKQAGDQAMHEPSAGDRAALDAAGPGAGSRTGDGAPVGRSPDEAAGVRVPERELVVVGARGGDDVARVGDDASRVGSDVGRVGDDVSRGGTGPGAGAVGDRPPMSPVAHAGGDGPGSTSTSGQTATIDGGDASALDDVTNEPRAGGTPGAEQGTTGNYGGRGGTIDTQFSDTSGAPMADETIDPAGGQRDLGAPYEEVPSAEAAALADAGADDAAHAMGRDLDAIQATDSTIPAPPRTPGDVILDSGDHVYFRPHSTTIGYDSATLVNRDLTAPLDGYHDVIVHGNPQGYFKPGRVNHAGVDFPPGEVHASHIVQAIKNNPDYAGGPVRLVSCDSGRVLDGLDELPAAQRVANQLGVPVMAPTDKVGIYRNLPPGQTSKVFNGGYWRIFLPMVD